ncbi:MAG: hypothetical protein HY248_00255, partial [Fimbriimonas ginsengisoli]|nr:hypothetical protein [Fimbriimonas ginsengisoli]
LEATGLKVTKKLIVDALMNYGMYYPSEGEIGSGIIKPQVRLEFVNSKENGLGIPLPKGKVKVYQRDASGSVQMLGEDAIEHTPKDEKLSLVVGRSFDIVAERKRLSFHVLTPRRWEETFQIELRNRKETADTVHVIERHWGDWRITDASDKWEKLDANAMQFVVELKAGEVRKVKYTVETTW